MNYSVAILFLFAFFIIFLAIRYPKKFIFIYFLLKPVIDYCAEYGTQFFGFFINTTYIGNTLFPLCALFIFLYKKYTIDIFPFKKIILSYLIVNILSLFLQGNFTLGSLTPVGIVIRAFLPIILYFTIPSIIKKESDIINLFRATAYAGIFPTFVGFMQLVGVIPYNRAAELVGKIVVNRITGGFADSFSMVMPIMFAILATFILLQTKNYIFKNQRLVLQILLFPYVLITLLTFHRMTYLIILVILIIWLIYNKHNYARIIFITALCIGIYFFADFLLKFIYDLYQPFKLQSDIYYPQAFHGRFGRWQDFLFDFSKADFIQKMLGYRMESRYLHNDYLRILSSNGIIGFAVYLLLLVVIGRRIVWTFLNYYQYKNKFLSLLSFFTLSTFIAYSLISFTLSISMISTLPWFFWISTGLLFYQTKRHKYSLSLGYIAIIHK